MRILMLGWEYPPYITGGLGTACHGLTNALSRLGHEVTFVMPEYRDADVTSNVKVIDALEAERLLAVEGTGGVGGAGDKDPEVENESGKSAKPQAAAVGRTPGTQRRQVKSDGNAREPEVQLRTVRCVVSSPYPSVDIWTQRLVRQPVAPLPVDVDDAIDESDPLDLPNIVEQPHTPSPDFLTDLLERQRTQAKGKAVGQQAFNPYAGDVIESTRTYRRQCLAIAGKLAFDVVHAHDWMTFPAARAIAKRFGKPFVAHLHSTEFDRSGADVYQPVYDIERAGLHAADRVITVSYLTRSILSEKYGIQQKKIDVVYNGVEVGLPRNRAKDRITGGDRIVLFLGRITMQKGPEFFIGAAKKVLEKASDVKFVMVGSGDRVRQIMALAQEEGIADRIIFTGFLNGADVQRVFNIADVYVMPSVSEPFGITPLEAIQHEVPAIISKQSGVSEVLNHVLKVDFWDVDDIAGKILAVLKHPSLGSEMRKHADVEVKRLTWHDAAENCTQIYARLFSRY